MVTEMQENASPAQVFCGASNVSQAGGRACLKVGDTETLFHTFELVTTGTP